MNTEVQRIIKLLERNWSGPMWYGTNLSEALKGISRETAFAKPQHASHNIYEYVRHMSTWRRFTIEQLKGNSSYRIDINSETDWATDYEVSDLSWQKALQDLKDDQAALIAAMANMTDDQLDETVPERSFKWYALLHGIIHHDIYHSAQISLLKKLAA
jgi:uncharacterized damage-inducible protein DinB